MIKNQNILCVSFPSWEGDYNKAIVRLISVLARENRILFVDYGFTWKDMLATLLQKQKAPVLRMLNFQNRLRNIEIEAQTFINILTPPPLLPINWLQPGMVYNQCLQWNAAIVKKSIQNSLDFLGMSKPIVINAFNPFLGLPMAEAFDEKLLLYYCYDEIGASKWAGKHGEKIERKLIKKVDAVITTSNALQQARQPINQNCYLVKNGVDFSLFNQAFSSKNSSTKLNKTVGYIGSVDERLDYELLHFLAEKAPNLQFHFIGRIMETKQQMKLRAMPNVIFLGPQPLNRLPDFLREMDLGVIPFKKSDFNRGIYPLKINEYLAAGKPVVMTDFAELPEFENDVSIAQTAPKFLAAIHTELETDCLDKQNERMKIAQSNSWENRIEILSRVIEQKLEEKAAL